MGPNKWPMKAQSAADADLLAPSWSMAFVNWIRGPEANLIERTRLWITATTMTIWPSFIIDSHKQCHHQDLSPNRYIGSNHPNTNPIDSTQNPLTDNLSMSWHSIEATFHVSDYSCPGSSSSVELADNTKKPKVLTIVVVVVVVVVVEHSIHWEMNVKDIGEKQSTRPRSFVTQCKNPIGCVCVVYNVVKPSQSLHRLRDSGWRDNQIVVILQNRDLSHELSHRRLGKTLDSKIIRIFIRYYCFPSTHLI